MENNGLVYTIYRPKGECIGTVVVVHGMLEHKKRYDYFATRLSDAGYAVLTYDQRGHGETGKLSGEFGYFAKNNGWNHLVKDCLSMVTLIKSEYPGVKSVLFGHSMGSIVARSFTRLYDTEINSLVLCGAPFYNSIAPIGVKLAQTISVFQGEKGKSKLLKDLVLGPFNKTIKNPRTDSDWISKNEENVDIYLKDPFTRFNFTNSAYADLMRGTQDMADLKNWNFTNAELSVLFISGEEDPCIGGEKGLSDSISRIKQAGYQKVKSIVYPGLRHEILNETEKDQVIDDVIEWLK